MSKSVATPDLAMERELWSQGYRFVAGVDEAGRGALAGPVVAGAVILPCNTQYRDLWTEIRDSKDLLPSVRAELDIWIRAQALCWGIGVADPAEIDDIGIGAATRSAMQRAILCLAPQPTFLLIDWVRLPGLPIRQLCAAKADARHVSVAAASIIAKEYRDRTMRELDQQHPGYAFGRHKGYGTKQHLNALEKLGACLAHRMSFAPIAKQPTLFDPALSAHTPSHD